MKHFYIKRSALISNIRNNMLRHIYREYHKVHNPLKIHLNAVDTKFPNAVVLLEGDKRPPSFARLNEASLEDLKKNKSLWYYPKNDYTRSLLLYNKKKLKEDREAIFSTAHTAVSALKQRKLETANVIFPKGLSQELLELWANTAILSNYKYSLKTDNQSDKQAEEASEEKSKFEQVQELNLVTPTELDAAAFEKSLISARCALFARDLANTRGSIATPDYIFSQVQALLAQHKDKKINLTTYSGEELLNQGFNMLYSVGKGATSPPRVVVLEYKGDPSSDKVLAFVGKGLTFDTGGLNLKPTNFIEDMYLDKSGACAALGAFKWAVETGHQVNLVCTLALAENAIGEKSFKPSDVLKSLNGITVEIGNTDAEGRLCLADAMTFTQRTYKPHTLIDLATLTGACVVALGENTAGVFGNNDELISNVIESGKYYKEDAWHLPITEEHEKSIKGATADITNSSKSRYGGASQAAAFLKKFIEKDVNWAHLDIAGPAMGRKARNHFSEGGTGYGVQLLTRFMTDKWN